MAFNLNLERKEGVTKCVRFPVTLLEDIEKVINENSVTFSRFVIQACKFALEDIEEQKKKEKEKTKC